MKSRAQKVSNLLLSATAGVASFVFSLSVFLFITDLDGKIAASICAGIFCVTISYIAAERPNSESLKALHALAERLLAVEQGDLKSPAPAVVQRNMPKVAQAVDSLFAEVRTSIDNAHALGMYDPVTSLPNRLHFRTEADKMMRAVKPNERPAMLFVDLDRFKAVNDSLGHARGDQLLAMVANRLRVVVTAEVEQAGARPLVARLAGDEFTIFFGNIESEEQIGRVARRIALAISEPFELHGHSIDIGASVGVGIAPEHGDSVETLMRAADIAMYHAKSLGGGRHQLFSEALDDEQNRKVAIEHELTSALQRNEFALAIQPQLSLITGEVTGAEALLRWNHPTRGVCHPGEFIEIAEGCGVITDMGDWVIRECADLLSKWQEAGGARRLAFNISPRQLDRADFFTRLRTAFKERGVPLSLVELEFTESTAMRVSDVQLAEIAAMRADGATIAIDDFGTGYSNIARLRTMPLDRVKLDPSLVADIHLSAQAREVVQAIVTLVRAVGAELVAEAIENADQAEILKAMGVETVQGYIFSQPMESREFFSWIAAVDRGHGRELQRTA